MWVFPKFFYNMTDDKGNIVKNEKGEPIIRVTCKSVWIAQHNKSKQVYVYRVNVRRKWNSIDSQRNAYCQPACLTGLT